MSAKEEFKGEEMHTDSEVFQRLIDAIGALNKPAIPLSIDLWDTKTVAAYLKRSESVVRERIACLPDFPKAIRPPSTKSVKGQPLYEAHEVIAWARSKKDKN